MLRILSLCLLSLAFLTTACSTDHSPEPTPSLEGQWELQSTYLRLYGADGQLLLPETNALQAAPKETLRFTGSDVTFSTSLLARELPSPIQASTHPYTRQDSTLGVTLPGFSSFLILPLTIVELTSTTLEVKQRLTQPRPSSPEGAVLGGRYTRQ